MQSLTHEYWMGYLKKIIRKALLPWVIYSILTLIYFAYTLDEDFLQADETTIIIWQALGGTILIFAAY